MNLSIVTTCVDMLKVTRRFVKLVERNTPGGYELIIVADRCDRKMLRWLGSLRAKVITNLLPVGSTTAFNQGLKEATGKYVALVNNDIEVTEGWLEPLILALKDHPEYGWVASRVIRGDIVANFGTACSLFLKDALDKVGLFDERFSEGLGWDDNDLLLRFWRAGYQPHGVSESVVYHPPDPTTLKALHEGTRQEKYEHNIRLFIEKWGPEVMNIDWINIPYE